MMTAAGKRPACFRINGEMTDLTRRPDHTGRNLEIQTRNPDAVRSGNDVFPLQAGMPVPHDIEQPEIPLDELKKIKLDLKHHN